MFWLGDYSDYEIMYQMQEFMLTNFQSDKSLYEKLVSNDDCQDELLKELNDFNQSNLETADEGELFDRTMK